MHMRRIFFGDEYRRHPSSSINWMFNCGCLTSEAIQKTQSTVRWYIWDETSLEQEVIGIYRPRKFEFIPVTTLFSCNVHRECVWSVGLMLSHRSSTLNTWQFIQISIALITAFNIVNIRFCMECSFMLKCEHKTGVLMVLWNTGTPLRASFSFRGDNVVK